jgi:HTH-type transcriptional regulator/antitoxin HipB
MEYSPKDIGELVKRTRNAMGVTQKGLALTAGTGTRFIIELEQGKGTCQLGKVLRVLRTLGIKINFSAPGAVAISKEAGDDKDS